MHSVKPAYATGWEVRAAARAGEWTEPTRGLAPGYLQAGLVAVPRDLAYDFLLFCMRNPKPCPIVDVTDVGSPEPRRAAPGADIRTDFPGYRIYRKGVVEAETTDIMAHWHDDLVGFLIGCSLSFEWALEQAGIGMREKHEVRGNPIYVTNIQCAPSGPFEGPMAVTMRPVKGSQVADAVRVTAALPLAHGAPVHVGSPDSIGVDLKHADVNAPLPLEPDDIPVFWACSITPQIIAQRVKIDFMITHSPSKMFVTDLKIGSV
ncbi:MAG: putative hydro-lyase [Firmicutes bacterium]|nr:putative hydro-lyase [Bacillota bacterium]